MVRLNPPRCLGRESDFDGLEGTHDTFVQLALSSSGGAAELLTPAVAQIITTRLLLADGPPLPELLMVTAVQELDPAEQPFCPVGYFGGSEAGSRRHFAECAFRLGDAVFDGVHIELTLLLQTDSYRRLASQVFRQSKALALDGVTDARELASMAGGLREIQDLQGLVEREEDRQQKQADNAHRLQQQGALQQVLRKLQQQAKKL